MIKEKLFNSIYEKDNILLLKLIVDNPRINLNVKNEIGNTLLMEAICKNNIEAIKILIKYDINLDEDNYDKETALFYAISFNSLEIIKILLKANADLNKRNYNGFTPLIFAAYREKFCDFSIIKYLIENNKIDLNISDNYINTALHIFSQKNNIDAVKLLINNKVNIELENNHGYTPLMTAVIYGNLNIIKLLVESNANINAKDIDGKTVLMHSIINRNAHNNKLIFLYLSSIIDIKLNLKDNEGKTALDYLYFEGPESLFPLLIEKGADLIYAALPEYNDYLIKNDPNCENKKNIEKLILLFSKESNGNIFQNNCYTNYNYRIYNAIMNIYNWSKNDKLKFIIKNKLEFLFNNIKFDSNVLNLVKNNNILKLKL